MMNWWRKAFPIGATALLLAVTPLHAASLRMSPIGLELTAPEKAGAISLTNTADEPVNLQVRIFKWSQADGKDVLTETRDVLVSPPATTIKAEETYTLRVVRTSSHAAVITAAITVTARYQQTCQITVAPVLDFGTVLQNTTDVTISATMVVNCTAGTSTTFGIWAPLSANGSSSERYMKNTTGSAGNLLRYTVQLGSASGPRLPTTGTNTGYASSSAPNGVADVGIVLVATIPAGQTLTQGDYVDDLTLTLSY